jgi:hypothetical protein
VALIGGHGPPMARQVLETVIGAAALVAYLREALRAGEGNRTLTVSLGS